MSRLTCIVLFALAVGCAGATPDSRTAPLRTRATCAQPLPAVIQGYVASVRLETPYLGERGHQVVTLFLEEGDRRIVVTEDARLSIPGQEGTLENLYRAALRFDLFVTIKTDGGEYAKSASVRYNRWTTVGSDGIQK